MKGIVARRGLALLLTVLAQGCSSVECPSADGPAEMGYGGFVELAKEAICARTEACGKGMPDFATCMAWNFGRPAWALGADLGRTLECSADEVTSGKLLFNSCRASSCIYALRTTDCALAYAPVVYAACARVLEGTVPLGGTCSSDWDCAGENASCAGCEYPPCSGTCKAAPPPAPAHLGEPCGFSACGDSYCNVPCSEGWCNDLAGYRCEPRLSDGSPCQRHEQCHGGRCGFTTGIGCFTPPKEEGAACLVGGIHGCAGALWCHPASMTCVPHRAAGESCSVDGPPCAGYGRCLDGTCKFAPNGGGLGESCTLAPSDLAPSTCDINLVCEMGTCVAPRSC